MHHRTSREAEITLIGLICLVFTVSGCAGTDPKPTLDVIYNKSAQDHGPNRNPIIAIPGILGSRLLDRPSGKVVWGAFEPDSADPSDPDGARLISLPIRDDLELAEIRDDVEPDGVLEKVRIKLVGIAFELQAYAGILSTLGAGGYRDQDLGLAGQVDYGDGHFTCFQFDYDWRRDNVENAQRLHAFILEKRAYLKDEYERRFGIEDAEIKFDIVAHSMGGLVTRYFLRYGSQELPSDGTKPELTWAGARYVERAIMVGTPNAGSLDAFVELVDGWQVGPTLPYYPPALMGTFPSIYQLLPRSRHKLVVWDGSLSRPVDDVLDADLWEQMGWGLASPRQSAVLDVLMSDVPDAATRRAVALRFQRRALERAKRFGNAMDLPAKAPEGLELFIVAGDAEATPRRVSVSSTDGTVRVIDRGSGDGVVLRSSALLDERTGQTWYPRLVTPIDFKSALFLPANHLDLTRSETFSDNVLYWLLEEPRNWRPDAMRGSAAGVLADKRTVPP